MESKVTIDIKGDDKSANQLLDDALLIISKKTIDDAHIYIFCSWKNYSSLNKWLRNITQSRILLYG